MPMTKGHFDVDAKAQLCTIGEGVKRTGIVLMFTSKVPGAETYNVILELSQAGELAERILSEVKRESDLGIVVKIPDEN